MLAFPSAAMASDFTGLLYFMYGVTAGLALVLALLIHLLTRHSRRILPRAVA